MAKTVGILTGGGDCPGLNAVIRAVVRRADSAGWDCVAVREGWRGLVEGVFEDLGPHEVSGILPRGGTIIGTSRTNPYKIEGGVESVLRNLDDRGLDALVAIGGEDTLGVASRSSRRTRRSRSSKPRETINNPLRYDGSTFGFDTAVMIAPRRIDRLHTHAETDNRVMVVEAMVATPLHNGDERDRRRGRCGPDLEKTDRRGGVRRDPERRHARGKY